MCGVRRIWSDRIKVVQEPLFPGYLFSRFQMEDRIRVLQAPGIRQIVASGDKPSPMGDDEIANLKILVSAAPVIVPWPYLPAGHRVRIERGPLAGMEGFVVRAEEGALRIVVSVDLLQRSVATEIDRDCLDVASYAGGAG
jgi:transcription antitermination factor NusG